MGPSVVWPPCPPRSPRLPCPRGSAHLVVQLLGAEGELHVAVVPRDLLRDDLRGGRGVLSTQHGCVPLPSLPAWWPGRGQGATHPLWHGGDPPGWPADPEPSPPPGAWGVAG